MYAVPMTSRGVSNEGILEVSRGAKMRLESKEQYLVRPVTTKTSWRFFSTAHRHDRAQSLSSLPAVAQSDMKSASYGNTNGCAESKRLK